MSVRYAGLLLAAVAVSAHINEVNSIVFPGSLHIDNRNGHVQRDLRSADNGNEERNAILETLSNHLASAFGYLWTKEAQEMTNSAWSALRNKESSLPLYSEGVAREYIETAALNTLTAEHRLARAEAYMVSMIVALRGVENPESLRNSADNLQQFLINVWKTGKKQPAQVFELLEHVPYEEGNASLVNDSKFAIWMAYMGKTFDHQFKNWADVQHNEQLRIEGDKEKKGGPDYVEGTESRGKKRGQTEAPDLEPGLTPKQKRLKRMELQRVKKILLNINLMGIGRS
uniref:Secreted RxLR effector protein 106 n=1 Tax=Hyaloperonospora arabidopsidis (strain Emoy2) TaxID=559515 RepID=RX106_HYAAE|nr:RecName: Full=Secreted RxLR effector protein 106; Flags: Precursor [Hyaloperonospora arabidopsidis Emoy2]